jgi:hypothetical protein
MNEKTRQANQICEEKKRRKKKGQQVHKPHTSNTFQSHMNAIYGEQSFSSDASKVT